jgi:hypothetical protein
MKHSQTLWLGGAVGALLGVSVAFLLSPRAKARESGEKGASFLTKVEPTDAFAVAPIVWALARRVQRIHSRSALGS